MTGMGHFDQIAPTSPSVGSRLGQGTFAEPALGSGCRNYDADRIGIGKHVHGQPIDRAIQAIGRTLPKRPGDEAANTITPSPSEPHPRKRRRESQTESTFRSLESGGRKRNRTAVRGFAVLCIATLPSGRGSRHIGARRSFGQGESYRVIANSSGCTLVERLVRLG